nr:hypothetical protein [uncultured Allomuricauda sp.]
MKKIFIIVSVFIGVNLNAQTQTQNLNMGIYELQFPSANGGNNRIQSYGGTFPGEWLFKSRFDDIYIDAGENSSNTYRILFLSGGIERARINNNGHFGIRTAQPDSPLSIGYYFGLPQLALERGDGSETFTVNINSSNQVDFVNKSGGGDYNFKTNVGGQAISSVLFAEGTNGNIGIGTTSPDAKLAVNGNIHTKEVKVDLVGWPDYVFEKDYNLPTLEEVEAHIAKNGHLQNIPSAQEVEGNGIKLGEMNSKLLQKIEELMLYTIQQEKKIKAMEKQLEKVQSYLKTN